MPFKDPEKRREYRREWYSKNKESEKAHVRRRKKEIKNWIVKYKDNLSCFECGESHRAIIDFHHKKGKKEKGISKMIAEGYSIERIKKELKKCIALCSNCHRKLHYKQNNKKL